MKDRRSVDAVDAAIAFGEGKITKKELADAAAAGAADAAVAYAAAAGAAAYAADAAVDARKKNQQETADICKKYLPIEIWNINS